MKAESILSGDKFVRLGLCGLSHGFNKLGFYSFKAVKHTTLFPLALTELYTDFTSNLSTEVKQLGVLFVRLPSVVSTITHNL